MNKILLKTQVILTYTTIITAAVISIFGLGFMSEFYTLFMNGNDAMYTFFKDIQPLNTKVFTSGLTFLVLALFLMPFDINKKIAGVFGVAFTLIITIINIVNGISIFTITNKFKAVYNGIDFTSLEDYIPSTTPFMILIALFGIAIVITLSLFITTIINYLSNKKERSVVSE